MAKKTVIEKEGQQIEEYEIESNGKAYKYKIQEPTFEQLSAALTESIGMSGKLNMTGGGKAIFELCCTEFDKEIEKQPRILMAICLDLYDRYVLPAEGEIKKK